MLYIDTTYFIKKLSIPNIVEPSSDAAIELAIDIDRYVSQFLKQTLGNILFEELKINTIDGELIPLAPQKWVNLVDGCNYTIDNNVYTWQGLRYSEGAFKVSLLANYVYLNQFQFTNNSMIGQIINVSKNAISQNPTEHLIDIWNEFVQMYQGECTNKHFTNYRNGVIFVDYYGNRENGYVSYLQFLKDNETDYPDFSADVIEYKNRFGL